MWYRFKTLQKYRVIFRAGWDTQGLPIELQAEKLLGLTGSKSENIKLLANELNLGLDSFIFIDDNPVERDRVRAALPDVLTPDWPVSPLMFPQALASLDCFDTVAVTDEDRGRAAARRAGPGEVHL
jgi:hypothetical protein